VTASIILSITVPGIKKPRCCWSKSRIARLGRESVHLRSFRPPLNGLHRAGNATRTNQRLGASLRIGLGRQSRARLMGNSQQEHFHALSSYEQPAETGPVVKPNQTAHQSAKEIFLMHPCPPLNTWGAVLSTHGVFFITHVL
jgi:hypothetical protein